MFGTSEQVKVQISSVLQCLKCVLVLYFLGTFYVVTVSCAPAYLPVASFPQDPQQLEALRPDVLRPLIDVVL